MVVGSQKAGYGSVSLSLIPDCTPSVRIRPFVRWLARTARGRRALANCDDRVGRGSAQASELPVDSDAYNSVARLRVLSHADRERRVAA